MRRIHLCARVPNEGARRLAWWICGTGDAGWRRLQMAGVAGTTVDRLLAGELVPGEALCRMLGIATGDAIGRRDWQRAARGEWFDRPIEHPRKRVA